MARFLLQVMQGQIYGGFPRDTQGGYMDDIHDIDVALPQGKSLVEFGNDVKARLAQLGWHHPVRNDVERPTNQLFVNALTRKFLETLSRVHSA